MLTLSNLKNIYFVLKLTQLRKFGLNFQRAVICWEAILYRSAARKKTRETFYETAVFVDAKTLSPNSGRFGVLSQAL